MRALTDYPKGKEYVQRLFLLLATAVVAVSQIADPAYTQREQAYAALRARNYDLAVASFERAIELAPDHASVRKDLAYTLLKTGENEAARDQFAEAMRLDPSDTHVALEYAFLCYETKQPVIARRTFERLRKAGDATAAEAFENIDRPLREGIARWQQALVLSPDNFSAHEELARLAEQRDQLDLAAEHYRNSWKLKPDRRDLLLDLGRVWKEQNRPEEAQAALLAASRGAEPRVAEQARELLPSRYPYVYEFEKALELDPSNVELRRELAYLNLQMNRRPEAEKQFQGVVERAPDDLSSAAQLGLLRLDRGDRAGAMPLLERVLAGKDAELADRVRVALRMPQPLRGRIDALPVNVSSNVKVLGETSFQKGYMQDALRYLSTAHENDPADYDVMLKLGWTYNILKDDRDAVKWFNLARRSPDPKMAAEASRAYRNLETSLARLRTTVWAFPTFSTRWHDLFAYSQVKTELRLRRFSWLRPYSSVRFVGDTHSAERPALGWAPQYLSEQSTILALGVATAPWHGATAWFEAGEGIRFHPSPADLGRIVPDYRGGLSFAKGLGHLLAPGQHGAYAETNDDVVYVRRFDKDTLIYSQNRTGYTFRQPERGAGMHLQTYWNWNLTTDVKRQYWANSLETGPGVRLRVGPILFSVDTLRGAYLVNAGNPHGPFYNDLRIGAWYAFTR
jgi:Tfp pilus assembly protein PilF